MRLRYGPECSRLRKHEILQEVLSADRCPGFALCEGHAEPAEEMLHDQSLDGFGFLTQQLLEGHIECVEVVRNLFASDLVALFNTLVDCVSDDLTQGQETVVDGVKQRASDGSIRTGTSELGWSKTFVHTVQHDITS